MSQNDEQTVRRSFGVPFQKPANSLWFPIAREWKLDPMHASKVAGTRAAKYCQNCQEFAAADVRLASDCVPPADGGWSSFSSSE